MANKPLKSIQFPGLSDTYTVPQVDASLATSGAAADAKKVGDEISDLKQDYSELANGLDFLTTGDITFESGSFNPDGTEAENSKRVRSEYIRAKAKTTVSVKSGYKFIVFMYDYYTMDYKAQMPNWSTSTYTLEQDRYIRIVLAKQNENDTITVQESSNLECLIITNSLGEINDNLRKAVFSNTDVSGYIINNMVINTNVAIDSVLENKPYYFSAWSMLKYPCSTGDVFTISGVGGSGIRLYCFVNEENVVKGLSTANKSANNERVTSPCNGYIYCNFDNSYQKSVTVEHIAHTDRETEERIKDLSVVFHVVDFLNGKINVGKTLGDTASFTPDVSSDASGWVCFYTPCKRGDIFKIKGYGGTSARLYGFTDNELKIYECQSGEILATSYKTVTAKMDGYFYFNSATATAYDVIAEKTFVPNEFIPEPQNNKKWFLPNRMPDDNLVVTDVEYDSVNALSLSDIIDGYDALVTLYPDYITKEELGDDASGDYKVYRYDFTPSIPSTTGSPGRGFGTAYTNADIPVIVIDACIHGFEKPCARALLNLMTMICNSEDGLLRWFRDNIHFVIIPVLNPYGYAHDLRVNYNHVDLNKNFPVYWSNGNSDPTSDEYRGSEPLSEPESQYLADILTEVKDNCIIHYSYHTHGLFDSYAHMTCVAVPNLEIDMMQQIGMSITKDITVSGWKNHNLPKNSGYIGFNYIYANLECGYPPYYANSLGIYSASPEVMYRYYDGETTAVYNNDTNTMNVEYMIFALKNALNKIIYEN